MRGKDLNPRIPTGQRSEFPTFLKNEKVSESENLKSLIDYSKTSRGNMEIDLTRGEKIGIAGALLIFVGSSLPWASWGVFSVSGVDGGDGVITLLLALGAGALILFRSWDMKNGFSIVAIGSTSFVIGFHDASNVASIAGEPLGMSVDVGSGLYLTIIGGIVLASAGLLDLFFEKSNG